MSNFDDIFENRLPEEEVREYLIELYERGEKNGNFKQNLSKAYLNVYKSISFHQEF